jgi:hypothetical protein
MKMRIKYIIIDDGRGCYVIQPHVHGGRIVDCLLYTSDAADDM